MESSDGHRAAAQDALISALSDVRQTQERTIENPMGANPGTAELMALLGIGHALLTLAEEVRLQRISR